MKQVNPFLLSLFLLIFLNCGSADTVKNIRLAIFDNPIIDSTNPLLAQDLQNAYMQGVKTAVFVAQKEGIHITQKTFFHGENLLNILQEAPTVKAWSPDVIVGLYSSNAALMARSFFTDQLVLPIGASDIELTELPDNFYSLGTPDLYNAHQLVGFISKQYPNSNLFILTGAESKESVDFSGLVSKFYIEKNPHQTVVQSQFLSDDVNTMDISSLVKGYKPGDIILLFSIAGTYSTQINVMNKIATYLTPNKITFITTVDNWKGRNLVANTNDTKNPYTALRLDTLYVDINSSSYKYFSKNFKEIYHKLPTDSISFITFNAVKSFITALEKYPPPKNLDTKKAILWSYHEALKRDSNWFRLMKLVVFKIEAQKEVYFTTLQ